MNLYQELNEMMDYIEQHLSEEISFSKLASFLGCSSYIMERIFSLMTGITLKEYIRKRRLSVATIALMKGERVIDVAFLSGYRSPTAFSRKFYEVYHIHPRDLKNNSIELSFQPVFSFDYSKQEEEIHYRIEKSKKMVFYGERRTIEKDIPSLAAPFWSEMKKTYPFLQNQTSYALIEREPYTYSILLEEKRDNLEEIIIPASWWLVFKSSSFVGKDIESLFMKVYHEYLKAIPYEVSHSLELEVYYDTYMEIWISII